MKYMNDIYYKIEKKIGIRNIRIVYFIMSVILSSGICFLGVYNGHDVKFHLSRVVSVADCIRNGVFPGIIYPNYLGGYGYANGAFYPDLFLYIPALLILLGIKAEISYNIFLILINVLAVFSTYLCVKRITKNEFCALLAGRLMVLSPYYLTDAYIRSALGEHLAFAFLPFVVLGLYCLFYEDYKKGGIYFTIGLVCIVYSHILSVLLCALFVVVFGIINIDKLIKEKERLAYCLIYGFLALGIGAYVCIPMLEMMNSDLFLYKVNPFSSQNMAPRAVPFTRLILDYTTDGDPWYPMGIGLVYIVLFAVCINAMFKKSKDDMFSNRLLVIGLLFLLCSTVAFPWKFINVLNVLQFPWRLYQITTVCFVIGFAYHLSKITGTSTGKKLTIHFLIMPFMMFTLLSFGYYSLVEGFELGFTRNFGYKISQGEYLPANLGGEFHTDRDFGKTYVEERGLAIESNHNVTVSFIKNGTNIIVDYSNNKYTDTYLDLPLIYYKGYKASENNRAIDVMKGDTGLVRVLLSEENGVLKVGYGFTTIRKISSIISLLSIAITATIYKKVNKIT